MNNTDTNKKITFLITGLELGGAEVLVKDIVTELAADKTYSVSVISLSSIGPIGAYLQAQGISVIACSDKKKGDLLRIWRLYRAIVHERPDILHSHLFHANILGRICGTIARVPRIYSTIHNINFGPRWRELVMRLTDILSNKTVVISDIVRTQMLNRGVVSASRVLMIENGVNIERFKALSPAERLSVRRSLMINDDTKYFIAVGRLMEQKGYPTLLESLSVICAQVPNIQVDILGEGQMRSELADHIKKLGLQKVVRLLGNTNQVLLHLQAADFFVMSSYWEGLPIALLEAMSTGCVPIVTSVGGIPEVVQNNRNGILVQQKNTDSLAEGLKKGLMLSRDEYQDMVNTARLSIVHNYSLDKTVAEYKKLYDQ